MPANQKQLSKTTRTLLKIAAVIIAVIYGLAVSHDRYERRHRHEKPPKPKLKPSNHKAIENKRKSEKKKDKSEAIAAAASLGYSYPVLLDEEEA